MIDYSLAHVPKDSFSDSVLNDFIAAIQFFPNQLESEVSTLSNEQKCKQYKPDSWNIAQIVNHLADSHSHFFLRLKFALADTGTSIKPYNQDTWSTLPDGNNLNITDSIALIKPLHQKITYTLTMLNENDWHKTVMHPEYNKVYTIAYMADLYAWHGRHHLAQIKKALAI